MAVPTTLQGKLTVVLQTTVQGKTTVVLGTPLQGKLSLVTGTELRSKTSIIETVEDTSLIKSAHIIADVNAAMVQGTFEFDGTTIGGINSANYWKHFEYRIPDYAGVLQPVFVGFFPSSSARYRDAEQNETMVAYSFGWYLSRNYLTPSDRTLLTPAHQAGIFTYRLQFDGQAHYFQVGNKVIGGTSGDAGVVSAVVNDVIDYIEIQFPEGGTAYPDPDDGMYYFQDDEELLVGGVVYAYADGHTTNVTGTIVVINPDDWIRRALGGDDWDPLYGLEPYRIADPAAEWVVGGAKPPKDFVFRDNQTIYDAISGSDSVTRYLDYLYFESWRGTAAGYQTPCVYWIPATDIDDGSEGLDLPAPVTITAPDGYLVSIDIDQKGEESFNRIVVKCRLLNGSWYTKTIESSGVASKTERPRTYPETATTIATAAECDARATALYNYYHMQTITWKVQFLLRSDFRRYQKLIFSGYSSFGLPDDTYRILRIDYDYDDEGCTNTQTCTIIADSAYLVYMSLQRSYTDTIREMQAIAKSEFEKYGLPEIGTVVSVDGNGGAMYTSEEGEYKPGIDADPA